MALRRSRRKNLALYIGVLMLLLIGYLTKELPELISGKKGTAVILLGPFHLKCSTFYDNNL